MPHLFFEDFEPGATDLAGSVMVTKEAIVAFARDYDPQPFHVDEAAARTSFAGGLIASGWHSCALLMRLVAEGFILDSSSMGAPGIEEVKWLKPVRPGDTLRARRTVLETKASRSRPEMGLVRVRFELLNQADEVVMTQANWLMMGRRDGPPAAPRSAAVERPAPSPPPRPGASPADDGMAFEDVAVGSVAELGSHTFTADAIIRFAQEFDPQPFHVDPEAAKRSHFGGLCASGWHTAAAWMRRLVDHRERLRERVLARGGRPVAYGPSPGFRDLRWLKPVYAGDTLTFYTRVVDKRSSASRPEWGLVFSHNTGYNQHGELVFEFSSTGFVERRG